MARAQAAAPARGSCASICCSFRRSSLPVFSMIRLKWVRTVGSERPSACATPAGDRPSDRYAATMASAGLRQKRSHSSTRDTGLGLCSTSSSSATQRLHRNGVRSERMAVTVRRVHEALADYDTKKKRAPRASSCGSPSLCSLTLCRGIDDHLGSLRLHAIFFTTSIQQVTPRFRLRSENAHRPEGAVRANRLRRGRDLGESVFRRRGP